MLNWNKVHITIYSVHSVLFLSTTILHKLLERFENRLLNPATRNVDLVHMVWAQLSAVILTVSIGLIQKSYSEITGTWSALLSGLEVLSRLDGHCLPTIVLRNILSSWKRVLLYENFHFQIILSFNHNNFWNVLFSFHLSFSC